MYKITATVLNWFMSYLSDRRQHTELVDHESSRKTILTVEFLQDRYWDQFSVRNILIFGNRK